jgi:hypothetical protein
MPQIWWDPFCHTSYFHYKKKKKKKKKFRPVNCKKSSPLLLGNQLTFSLPMICVKSWLMSQASMQDDTMLK